MIGEAGMQRYFVKGSAISPVSRDRGNQQAHVSGYAIESKGDSSL